VIVTVFEFFDLGDSLNIHSRINLTQNVETCVNIKLLDLLSNQIFELNSTKWNGWRR